MSAAAPSPRAPGTVVDVQQLRDRLDNLFIMPDLLPDRLLSFLVDYLSVNQPLIPISSLSGFTQFSANNHVVAGSVTTTSTTFVNLSGGPTLSLPDGNYILSHGYTGSTSVAGNQAMQSLLVNSTAAVNTDACQIGVTTAGSVMTAVVKELTEGSNTVTCQYKCQAGSTGTFANRFLIAQRFANL